MLAHWFHVCYYYFSIKFLANVQLKLCQHYPQIYLQLWLAAAYLALLPSYLTSTDSGDSD